MHERQRTRLELRSLKGCVYHQQGKHDFTDVNLGPPGLDLDMYYTMYPLAFSYVYGADMPGGAVTVNHPTIDGVSFVLRERAADPLMRLKNLVKDATEILRTWHKEVRNIEMVPNQTFADVSGPDGQLFNLNGRLPYMCPAAFTSIYPHVSGELAGEVPPDRARRIACPDHEIDQVFTHESERGEPADVGCYDFSRVRLVATAPDGTQIYDATFAEILARMNVRCGSAFQVLTAYWLTLSGGGGLGFYTGDRASCVVQCPNARRKVEFVIERDRDGAVGHRVQAVKAPCPSGYRAGDSAEMLELPEISVHATYVAYMYAVRLLQRGEGSHRFRDPSGARTAAYALSLIQ